MTYYAVEQTPSSVKPTLDKTLVSFLTSITFVILGGQNDIFRTTLNSKSLNPSNPINPVQNFFFLHSVNSLILKILIQTINFRSLILIPNSKFLISTSSRLQLPSHGRRDPFHDASVKMQMLIQRSPATRISTFPCDSPPDCRGRLRNDRLPIQPSY